MLTIRPNCECCDKDLPADSTEACICSYECTFCRDCVANRLNNVCPNCGGGFTPRPIRPASEHRPGVSLQHHPASTDRVHTPYSPAEIRAFTDSVKSIKPENR
ncbi:hypothetical protein SAMN03080615_01490 [Amphritea atlantica]|uniref:Urease-associated protein n=1 Tax=Amphritea atlantica TaxID=355243 RepID=A0A1H9FY06_9GAMM|nr:DUF1272 domain-containing protein [Amphritea atlantica]SEQ42473.1 hypothetical protein SAMN03080615_01490 [Amphritea atlantica]